MPSSPSPSSTPPPPPLKEVDILILGFGWSSHFLPPLLHTSSLTFASTSTTGREGTIPFRFPPASLEAYTHLPPALTILITFPLKTTGQAKELVDAYTATHPRGAKERRWVLLGSTGAFSLPSTAGEEEGAGYWVDRLSPIDLEKSPRCVAEAELLALLNHQACILHLAGLWGDAGNGQQERHPRTWIPRVAKTKEDLREKGFLHLIHGADVARAIVGCMKRWEEVGGERWLVVDTVGYDWWGVVMGWGGKEERGWVGELLREEGVRGLPRGEVGRRVDGREFWEVVGEGPRRGLMGDGVEGEEGEG
ncbi:MAG: hypothetical protein Q9220_007335 [cf. Caloplaca sp. 1 TL-2023]